MMNSDQCFIYDTIMNDIRTFGSTVSTDRPRVHFIDAPGGTGKTFVFNAIIAAALSQHHKVASCAWIGIAG